VGQPGRTGQDRDLQLVQREAVPVRGGAGHRQTGHVAPVVHVVTLVLVTVPVGGTVPRRCAAGQQLRGAGLRRPSDVLDVDESTEGAVELGERVGAVLDPVAVPRRRGL
jgi:hypothetical protein